MFGTYDFSFFCSDERKVEGYKLALDKAGDGCAGEYCHFKNSDDRTYCVYCKADKASMAECERKLFPRQEVACQVRFRSSNECYLMCD
jgi:hypothetical protein